MAEHTQEDLLEVYERLTRTFVFGWRRMLQARLVYKCTEILSIGLHTEFGKLEGVPANLVAFIRRNRFDPGEFDSYTYIGEATHLVYATALLDTFINETSLFLFLARPEALAEKGQQVPLTEVLGASSQAAYINALAQQRVRRLGQETFSRGWTSSERSSG